MVHGAGEHVLRAQKLRDVGRRRLAEDALRRSGLQHASAIEKDGDVTKQSRLGEIVRDLENRDVPVLMKRAHLSAHAHATAWIQRAERLVEQQNRWPRRERTRDGDELPLAAREGAYGSSQQRVCPDAR